MRPITTLVGSVGLVLWMIAAASPTATAGALADPKPVIGRPVASPLVPLPGRRFDVSFKVTRSDTGSQLTRGTMVLTPTVDGQLLAHSESLRGGTARLSLVVPARAQGKLLRVKLVVKFGGSSATRSAAFRIGTLPKSSLSIGDASVVEGNSGVPILRFPLRVSTPTPLRITVGYTTSDGSATAGSDYTARRGSITIRPGQMNVSIVVSALADEAVELDETMTVTLTGAVNATIADRTGTGTITNDDVAARSGHYTGSTSLFTFIAFDVGDGARTLTGMFFFADLTCDTPLSSLRNVKFEVLDAIPVEADGRYAITSTGTTAERVTFSFTVEGRLTAPSSATGTLRVVDVTSGEPPFRGAHCRTADVTWTASLT